jgi:hypothetical protein
MKDLASTKNQFFIPYYTRQPSTGFTTAPTARLTWLKNLRDANFLGKTLKFVDPLFDRHC